MYTLPQSHTQLYFKVGAFRKTRFGFRRTVLSICCAIWTRYSTMYVNPFPAVVEYTRLGGMPRVAGRPDGPCDPRAPVQSL